METFIYRVKCIADDGKVWYRKTWYSKAGIAKGVATRKNRIAQANKYNWRYFVEKYSVNFIEVI